MKVMAQLVQKIKEKHEEKINRRGNFRVMATGDYRTNHSSEMDEEKKHRFILLGIFKNIFVHSTRNSFHEVYYSL